MQTLKKLRYGAFAEQDGFRFTLPARQAQQIQILLFDQMEDDVPTRVIDLQPETDRRGDCWSRVVMNVQAGTAYAYRIDGEPHWTLDPWARRVYRGMGWEIRGNREQDSAPSTPAP